LRRSDPGFERFGERVTMSDVPVNRQGLGVFSGREPIDDP
jgi:hypothetical protein